MLDRILTILPFVVIGAYIGYLHAQVIRLNMFKTVIKDINDWNKYFTHTSAQLVQLRDTTDKLENDSQYMRFKTAVEGHFLIVDHEIDLLKSSMIKMATEVHAKLIEVVQLMEQKEEEDV